MTQITPEALTESMAKARTGHGLSERQNDQGHYIRDAWVHKMMTVDLPDAIEALTTANAALAQREAEARAVLQAAMPVVHKAQVAATMEAINAPPDDPTTRAREVWREKCVIAENTIAAWFAASEDRT
jgi:hypothetical protein